MRSAWTVLAGVLCAAPVVAQDTTTTTTTTTTTQYQRVSTVVGHTVLLGRESLGKVTEIVIDSNGCIAYLVVQYGDGFVPIPWAVTTVNFEQRQFVIQSTDITVDRLRELTFTEARWPNFADQQFTQRVRTVWGERALRTEPGTRPGATDRKGTDRPGTTDRKGTDRPGTADRPGTTDRKDPPAGKDRPDPATPPKRPKDPASGAERPKLDPPASPPKDPVRPPKDKKDPDKKDQDKR